MSDVRWLTYDELSAEMGITRESARQLAIRKRWGRQKGNDGKARVGVPAEALQARMYDDTGDATPSAPSIETGHGTSDKPSDVTGVVQALTRHIERLESERASLIAKLVKVETERDAALTRAEREGLRAVEAALQAATVEPLRETVVTLKAALEAEKQRITELRQERNRWEQLATAPRGFLTWIRR